MKISLIIPVKNDFEMFCKTFDSVLKQILLPNQIIIIDSSKDEVFYKKNKFRGNLQLLHCI